MIHPFMFNDLLKSFQSDPRFGVNDISLDQAELRSYRHLMTSFSHKPTLAFQKLSAAQA